MSIIIHPQYQQLKNKLSELIFEYNDLKFHICPLIEIKYVKNFGELEYELYKKDVEISKLKRKLNLIQIEINNGNKIDMEKIDQQLEEEFLDYELNLIEQMSEIEKVKNNQDLFLSDEDSKKLKSLYKKCVLALHPDLNGDLSDNQLKLFTQITESFKNGDLKSLESLYTFVPAVEVDGQSDLDRLNELIEYNEEKIKEIKENYPYNKLDLLKDLIKC